MKRLVTVLVMAGLFAGTTYCADAVKKTAPAKKQTVDLSRQQQLPETINVTMPGKTGKMELIKVPGKGAKAGKTKIIIPNGTEIIVTGLVTMETPSEAMGNKQLVIVTETGEKYAVGNPPYYNTLRFNALGRTVKVKGKHINGAIAFKNYNTVFVEDILEVKAVKIVKVKK